MDHKLVEKLEEKIEKAIAEIIDKLGLKKLPLLPDRRTMHDAPDGEGGGDGLRSCGRESASGGMTQGRTITAIHLTAARRRGSSW